MKKILVLLAITFSSSAAIGEMYTWKDAKGTAYYTNSLHEIPARYLKKARVLDVATGKKGGPATAHPGTPGTSSPAVGQAPAPQPQMPQPAPVAAAPAQPPAAAAPAVAAPVQPPAQPVTEAAPVRPQNSTRAAQRRAARRAAMHGNDE